MSKPLQIGATGINSSQTITLDWFPSVIVGYLLYRHRSAGFAAAIAGDVEPEAAEGLQTTATISCFLSSKSS